AYIDRDKICLEGTRVDIIDKISQWINNTETNVPKIFFLHGPAGTGKSAIAHTIGKQCKDQGCLGAFFRFDRTFSLERTPSKALRSIAYNMAINLPKFKNGLHELLNTNPYMADSTSLPEQWENLIQIPAQLVLDTKPVVIIIDALDECGPQEVNGPRRQFLSVMMKGVRELPYNFRVLVTSRSEKDILEVLTKYAAQLHIQDMSELEHTKEDIYKYVVHKMQRAINEANFTHEQCETLAKRAEKHFQWAFTVCQALYQEVKAGVKVKKRFEKFMALNMDSRNGLNLLDQLYKAILAEIFDPSDNDAMNEYRKVVGQILAASEPVSKLTLQSLQIAYGHYLGETDSEQGVDAVIPWLGSLFIGVNELNVPIRPVHTSVRDFLLDETRSHQFAVPIAEGHKMIGVGCIKLMTEQLHFNICGLPNSYLRNSELQNIEDLIKGILPEMLYACCFWDIHLPYTPCDNKILGLINAFIMGYSLFWMEVLSLLNRIDMARDIKKCVNIFGKIMVESTPHLYVSALPFLPAESILSKATQQQFHNVAKICKGQKEHWPSIQAILVGHKKCITSVAFSLDGKKIASGSLDSTVRIWDAETGNAIGKPLKEHKSSVHSVAFSPDGMKIVSGSSDFTVRIWDVETGNAIGGPLLGHNNPVQSVAFSPDGMKIVSGSSDCTIRIWDAETGNEIGTPPQKRHNNLVQSVAFSPDGRRIVSGSDNFTMRIWDAETGNAIGKPLKGHNDSVQSVSFSPDGKRIVSGSLDSTV
ncbi:hypothetical protein GYMLUDRAFT_173543, partial [Collybiopsis luxurians FD-317 M1]